MFLRFLTSCTVALLLAVSAPAQSAPSPTPQSALPDSTELEITRTGHASYPSAALAGRIQGKVVIQLSVDQSGKVTSQKVVNGHPMLTDEALRAAREYEFKPYIRSGEPTPFITELIVDFRGTQGIFTYKPTVVQLPESSSTSSPSDQVGNASAPSVQKPNGNKLRAIHSEAPTYPEEVAPDHRSALVAVKMSVNERGEVDNAEALSGDPAFHKQAVATARKWKFEPYLRDGKPTRVTTMVTFGFGYSWRAPDWQPANPPKRVRVSEEVSRVSVLHKVIPRYPQEAKNAHIQGSVVFRVTIGPDGNVKELETLKGPLELQASAGEAVRQWQYKPYLLNGEPVEVEAQITVNYTLSLH